MKIKNIMIIMFMFSLISMQMTFAMFQPPINESNVRIILPTSPSYQRIKPVVVVRRTGKSCLSIRTKVLQIREIEVCIVEFLSSLKDKTEAEITELFDELRFTDTNLFSEVLEYCKQNGLYQKHFMSPVVKECPDLSLE